MFSRKDQLLKKTGPDGIGRYDYLRLLKKEFEETISSDAKGQILANLTNFAYDPINYEYMRALHIIDLFIAELQSDNYELRNFAAAAICNISSDPLNSAYIIRRNGMQNIINVLTQTDEEIVLNILTSLYFIKNNLTVDEVNKLFTEAVILHISNLKENTKNKRIDNIITILLE